MATSRKLEGRIEQVRQLRTAGSLADVLPALRRALQDRANLVVAEAAKTAAIRRISELIPDLLNAFDRLFTDPVKTDPKCWGKTAIVKALIEFDYDQSPPFVRGAKHIQMEPVWGGQEDAASAFRATCVLALVQCSDLLRIEKFRYLVDALTDAADQVRVEAVRAVAQMGGDEAELLLRLKARAGDKRALITGHLFDALLSLDRDHALGFVARYLKADDVEARDEAALALGASRSARAVQLLIDAWNGERDKDFSSVLLRALSSSRDSKAIEFLLDVVKTGLSRDVAAALDALKLHEGSEEIMERVKQAKSQRA